VDFGRITFPYLLFISLGRSIGRADGIDRFAMSPPRRCCSTSADRRGARADAVPGPTRLCRGDRRRHRPASCNAVALDRCARTGRYYVGKAAWTARVARLVKLATPVGWAARAADQRHARRVWASLLLFGTIPALYYATASRNSLGVVWHRHRTALLPLLARQLRAGEAPRMANHKSRDRVRLLFSLPAALALWLLADR